MKTEPDVVHFTPIKFQPAATEHSTTALREIGLDSFDLLTQMLCRINAIYEAQRSVDSLMAAVVPRDL
jgi:hypothetical protein